MAKMTWLLMHSNVQCFTMTPWQQDSKVLLLFLLGPTFTCMMLRKNQIIVSRYHTEATWCILYEILPQCQKTGVWSWMHIPLMHCVLTTALVFDWLDSIETNVKLLSTLISKWWRKRSTSTGLLHSTRKRLRHSTDQTHEWKNPT